MPRRPLRFRLPPPGVLHVRMHTYVPVRPPWIPVGMALGALGTLGVIWAVKSAADDGVLALWGACLGLGLGLIWEGLTSRKGAR